MSVEELKKMSEFTKKEVYHALWNLKNRRLIEIERIIGKAGYKNPPTGKIYVNLNKNSLRRIKGLIENDK